MATGAPYPPLLQRGRGTAKRWRGAIPYADERKSKAFAMRSPSPAEAGEDKSGEV
jgi:hypothetical protein